MAVARYGAIRNIRDEDPYRYLGGTPGLLGRKGPYRGLMGPRQYQGKANIPRGTTATKVAPEQEQYKPPDPLSMYTSGKEAYDVTFGDAGIFTEKGQAQMGKQFDEYGKQVGEAWDTSVKGFDDFLGGVGKWFGGADEGLAPDIGLGRTKGFSPDAGQQANPWFPSMEAYPNANVNPNFAPPNTGNPYNRAGIANRQGILPQAPAGSTTPSNMWGSNLQVPARNQANIALNPNLAPQATDALTNVSGLSSTGETAAQAEKLSQMTDLVKGQEAQAASNLAKGTSGFGAAMGGVTAALSAADMIENGASVGNVTGLMGGGMVAASFFSPALAALGPWGAGIAAVGAVGSWFDWW